MFRSTGSLTASALMLLLADCGGGSSVPVQAPPQPQSVQVPLLLSDASSEDWSLIGVKVLSIDLQRLDQVAKSLVQAGLRPGDDIPLLPVLSLVLTFNTGAAFSFLAGADGWQRWLFTVIAIAAAVFIVWLIRRGGSRLYLAGLALILGGALGNLVDRLVLGHVVDFVLLHWRGWTYPAFNVADSAITIGAACLIVDSFRHRRADQRKTQTAKPVGPTPKWLGPQPA